MKDIYILLDILQVNKKVHILFNSKIFLNVQIKHYNIQKLYNSYTQKINNIFLQKVNHSFTHSFTYKLNEKNNRWRWVILLFIILSNLGNFFSDDFPAVLENQLKTQLQMSALQYNLLYSILCIPPLALLAGYLIDKLGVYKVMITCSILQNIGQSLFTFGLYQENYYTIVFGRFIFGIGLENFNICGFNIIDRWFPKSELSFAMGFIVSIGRISMLTSSFVYPIQYDKNKLLWEAAFIGVYVCIISFFSVICLNFLDRHLATDQEKQKVQTEKIKFKDIKKFKGIYWLIIFTICFSFMILEPFMANMQEIMIIRYDIQSNHASNFYTFPFLLGAIFIPLVGILVDKFGNRGTFAILGGLLFNSFFLLLYKEATCRNEKGCYVYVFIALSILGLGYGILQSVLWPCINLVVRQKNLGTAGGVANFVLQTGLLINPIFIGIIQDQSQQKYGYDMLLLFCFGESLLITLLAIIFTYKDYKDLRLITDVEPKIALSQIWEYQDQSLTDQENISLIKGKLQHQ
ncbi:major facilitator superfamily protein, putative [Ichthyophthirius multifiliis]|uniref:Lysosomal dipeptide transporter MFSD1 n=1 Tax=Ichthyophthirius multifiliis TaxID=5932 RepID=G0QQS1_ICHMU|nr:major facilitator superfamily protein, putative [Ichthyophthirius multifiliis]EGR32442.1 major facilitator superfamily protein, putative [Ichthyophthirius multifiliis]|eukprot:XP_004036428.1 major facilitator superfamily protein, putative [Ichthyophthirius multifiliis]